jgi:Flp pilus assembly pilin Flp
MRIDPRAEIRRLLAAPEGATAIEYAVIAAGVGGAIVVAVTALGGRVTAMWTAVAGIFN